jgi:hypothetical protein
MEGDREELMTPEEAIDKYVPNYNRSVKEAELLYKDMCVAGIKRAITTGKKSTIIYSPEIVYTVFRPAKESVILALKEKGYVVNSSMGYIVISWE